MILRASLERIGMMSDRIKELELLLADTQVQLVETAQEIRLERCEITDSFS